MSLSVKKETEETWRECVERYAKPFGLEYDALQSFDSFIKSGLDEDEAAYCALGDWDLLDFIND